VGAFCVLLLHVVAENPKMVGCLCLVGEVFVLKTSDRAAGVAALLEKIGLSDYGGKTVAVKANYNSADPFPASTHPDTLRALVHALKAAGAGFEVTLAERSGMGDTSEVLDTMASPTYPKN
jgi:uncharacterized protein (DUF362 family)